MRPSENNQPVIAHDNLRGRSELIFLPVETAAVASLYLEFEPAPRYHDYLTNGSLPYIVYRVLCPLPRDPVLEGKVMHVNLRMISEARERNNVEEIGGITGGRSREKLLGKVFGEKEGKTNRYPWFALGRSCCCFQ